jgi:predicted O-methyltransferase YrrM
MTKQRDEEFDVNGEDLVDKIKGFIHEGNVRRIIIKNKDGKAIIEIPLTIGVVSAVMAPALAAVGAIAALITDCTITVQREL